MNVYKRIHPKEFTNSYWCPECGKLINITCGRSIQCDIEYDADIQIMSANIDLNINCTKCDSYMLPIDYLISKQIKQLNDMGIKTMYCCAGHLNMTPNIISTGIDTYSYNIEHSYIAFANIPENEHCKFVVKRLLTLQEFGFITFEENDETWIIRAYCDLIKTFSDIRYGFIRFVDTVILNINNDSFDAFIESKLSTF